ncbi:MAG: putative quinol monooxygenase [Sedimentisphaeraceae bacterium JB056]
MAKLIIVADIVVKAEHVDFVKSEMEKLLPVTRAEEGCLQYDLHVDNNNPSHFMFYEAWESRELWQVHMNAQHLKDYIAATDGMLEKFGVSEMTLVQ